MKAVIMAGGFGTRIQPLTNSIPKPMLPIFNKPMMEHIILKLKNAGIAEFVVLLYFKPDIIKDYFKDGKEFGINITYVLPDDDYGTAGALKCAEEYLKDDNFIIVSGDLVTDFDLNKIIDFHKKRDSQLTITLTSVEDPLQFGVVIANSDDKIEKFLEKPSWGEVFSDTINTGIYVLEPHIMEHIPAGKNFDFAKDLFPKLMKSGIELMGFSIKGYWRDVGNPQSYRDVYSDILNEKIIFDYEGNKQKTKKGIIYSKDNLNIEEMDIKGVVVTGKNLKIGKNSELKNVVIGDNVTIADNVKLSSGVVWDNSKIGEASELSDFVVCNDTAIGKNAKAKNGVIISEKCKIGSNVSFEKDVTVWPKIEIERNSIVSNNIVWGSKYKSSIFENGTVVGRTNVELSCEMLTKLAESFGSALPSGSIVYVSRDYHKSSRMLKRAFLGGLLSAGVNVYDLKLMPCNIMTYNLEKNSEIIAGVHIKQSAKNHLDSEIFFFTQEGVLIDNNAAKNLEKVFFKESFRRVDYQNIGEITEKTGLAEIYKKSAIQNLKGDVISNRKFKIAVDLLHGSMSEVFPAILNELNVSTLTINAHMNDDKLLGAQNTIPKAKEDISKIVRAMEFDAGFMIYPGYQELDLICEDGKLLQRHIALLVVLYLIDKTAQKEKKPKIILPAWSCDFVDELFKNITIERGKLDSLKGAQLDEYLLKASGIGCFSFTGFAHGYDSAFASLKILEMLAQTGEKLSNIVSKLEEFYYFKTKIDCLNENKGKIMRKFLEDSKEKEASHIDGVKIWLDKKDWILMIPDQYHDNLNIYIQAKDKKAGDLILQEYTQKIEAWLK